MKSAVVWASRDGNKDRIKIWGKEPVLKGEEGLSYVGKDYLGISCLDKWPGPSLSAGQKMLVAIMIVESL